MDRQTGQVSQNDSTFLNPDDKFWNLYITDAEKHDKIRLGRWKGDTDGILIFTGLFAATVATFVVSTIPGLSPDTGDQTVALLAQVLVVLANQTENVSVTSNVTVSSISSFEPSTSSLWVNTLWLVSLVLSLVCAMAATLVQRWTGAYSQGTQRRGSPSIRGPVYAGLAQGIERFRMGDAITAIVSMLHISVMIFLAGLLVMLFSTNRIIASVLSIIVAASVFGYIGISIMPVVAPWTPYRTPFSAVVKYIALMITFMCFYTVVLSRWVVVSSSTLLDMILRTHMLGNKRLGRFAQTMEGTANNFSGKFKWLSLHSVGMAPMACEPYEQDGFRCYALRQVHNSVDELHEVQELCESLIPMLAAAPRKESGMTPLVAKSVICELNIFVLLEKLAESCITSEPAQDLMASRRMAVVITLVRSLARRNLFLDTSPHGVILRVAKGETDDEFRMLRIRWGSKPLGRMLKMFQSNQHKLLADQYSNRAIFSCSFAAFRADVLAIVVQANLGWIEHFGYDAYFGYDHLAFRSSTWLLQEVICHGHTSSLWLWHSKSRAVQADAKSPTALSAIARQYTLDNLLWALDRIFDFASGSHGSTLRLLDSLHQSWYPQIAHTFNISMLYFPQSHRLMNATHADVERMMRRLGVWQSASADLGHDWLSLAANREYLRSHVSPGYFELFERYPCFSDWLSIVCGRLNKLGVGASEPVAPLSPVRMKFTR